jgi:hypothetical protein
VPERREARRAEHDGARAADQLAQLVRQRGELAELDHVVGRHLGVAEALRRTGRDGVRRGGDLLLAEVEASEHDGLAVEVPRDVDVLAVHGLYDSIGR